MQRLSFPLSFVVKMVLGEVFPWKNGFGTALWTPKTARVCASCVVCWRKNPRALGMRVSGSVGSRSEISAGSGVRVGAECERKGENQQGFAFHELAEVVEEARIAAVLSELPVLMDRRGAGYRLWGEV